MPEEFNPDWIDHKYDLENNLSRELNSFKLGEENELMDGDSLFFFFIDHGGNKDSNTYFGCPYETIPSFLKGMFGSIFGLEENERLYDYEMESYVENIIILHH